MPIKAMWSRQAGSQEPLPFLDALLDHFEHNPFHPLEEMWEWQDGVISPNHPYNSQYMRQILHERRDATVGARTKAGDLGFTLEQASDALWHNVDMTVSTDLATTISTAQFVEYVRQTTHLITHTTLMSVAADPHADAFYQHHQLPKLVFRLCDRLDWLNTLAAYLWQPYISREEMLNTPAFAVYEESDGAITLQLYEHLLEYDLPQNQQRIIEVARYLDAHSRKPPPPSPEPAIMISEAEAFAVKIVIDQDPAWEYDSMTENENVSYRGRAVSQWRVYARHLATDSFEEFATMDDWLTKQARFAQRTP